MAQNDNFHPGRTVRNVARAQYLPSSSLKTEEDDGTSGAMEIIDAKISATEARTDTKFAELLGELRLMNQRLDQVEKSTANMHSTVIGTGIGVVAVVIAVMAYGAQWFGIGLDAQQVSERAAQAALNKVEPKFDDLDQKLDQLLQATRPRPTAPQQ